jgi:poly[(R)-3-hydroxyalkanoate] polymerase subunit PhaC
MAGKAPTSSAKRSSNASKSSTRSGAKKTSKPKTAATRSGTRTTRATGASRNGSKRSTSTRSTASRSTASRNGKGGGVVDTAKSVAGKAAGPAVAVGAAAVGIAGGIALKSRTRRKTVLGVRLPRSVGKSITNLDGKSMAKSVGQASKRFAKTTKNVSKDLERAGDQAERIGKILD